MTNTEDGEPTKAPEEDSVLNANAAAISQITSMIEEVRSKKTAFDSQVESVLAQLSEHVAEAESASAKASGVREEIITIKSAMDAERDAIQQLGAKAKTSSSEIEALRTEIATAKGAIDTTLTSATSELAAITQNKASAGELIASATALSQKLTKEHDEIAGQIASLKSQQTALQTLMAEVGEAKAAVLKDAEVATAHAAETQNARTKFVQLTSDTESQYTTLTQRQATLQAKISEIENVNAEIKQLRRTLLENVKGGERSVQQQIVDLHTEITATFKEVADDRDRGSYRADAAPNLDRAKQHYPNYHEPEKV